MSATARPETELMATRKYRHPPVHELVLDVQFHENLEEPAASTLPDQLQGEFGTPQRLEEQELELTVGPEGQQLATTKKHFAGWRFETATPKWVVQCSPSQLTLHAVRSQKWPSGAYIGWEKISERYEGLLPLVKSTYGTLTPKRVGLRYLNRIAVPEDHDPREWFALWLEAPPFLRQPYSFDLRQTWASVEGADDVSATVRLVKIKIEDEAIARGHIGALLDIDVFNLWVRNAPPFSDLPPWFARAHAIENRIFEASISDVLRTSFDRE
ncbi:MAG: TIGR04255 family protein [Gemmatimonadales bacterium]